MKKIIDPDEIFSVKEIKHLRRWISYYENPIKLFLISTFGTFFGVILLIILLVQFDAKLPKSKGGVEGELFFFSCIVGFAVLLCTRAMAKSIFTKFDNIYFQRTGLTEDELLNAMSDSDRQEALIRFTELPNGDNITMFNFPEEYQDKAYEAFETNFLKRRRMAEKRLKFKAYVARSYGLQVPMKKWKH